MLKRCLKSTKRVNESLMSMKAGFLTLISTRNNGKEKDYGIQLQTKLSVRKSTSLQQCLQMVKFG